MATIELSPHKKQKAVPDVKPVEDLDPEDPSDLILMKKEMKALLKNDLDLYTVFNWGPREAFNPPCGGRHEALGGVSGVPLVKCRAREAGANGMSHLCFRHFSFFGNSANLDHSACSCDPATVFLARRPQCFWLEGLS